MISALISAVAVLVAAAGWLLRLRAAMVDVYEEIRANARQLQAQDPLSWHASTFSVRARDRSWALLRQACSRATCSAVADAYSHVEQLHGAGSRERQPLVGDAQVADAMRASDEALAQLDRSFEWQKWRRPPPADSEATILGGAQRMRLPPVLWGVLVALVALPTLVFGAVRLLGSGDDDRPGPGAPSGVSALHPKIMQDARGTISLCTGKDVSGARRKARNDFNSKFGADDLRANIVEFPEQADQQYEEFSRLQRARSDKCDVFFSDVVWTADFAQQGWLRDLSPYVAGRRKEFVPAMLDTVTFEDKQWGVPKQADAGLLFYRKSRVADPPATWQALYEQSKPGKRYRYQARAYEGLTVNFLEVAYAAGAQNIVTAEGRANIDQPAALEALRFMVDGLKEGVAPRDVVDQKEEESRRAFLRGRADLMRNWPYVYGDALRSSIADDVAVTPLPRWDGEIRASVLGGQNLVISSYSKNPAAALKLIDYLSGTEVIKQDAVDYTLAPVLLELWDDPAVRRSLPAFEDLEDAIHTAQARPVVPNYQDVSRAIYTNVNRALQREVSPEDALEIANDQMQQALDTG